MCLGILGARTICGSVPTHLRTFCFQGPRGQAVGPCVPMAPHRGGRRALGLLPSRLQGFRLKRALSKLWASMLRNWGMPSLALQSKSDIGGGQSLADRLLQALPSCSVSISRPTGSAQSDRSSTPCCFGCRDFGMESQWGHQRVFVYVGCTH